MHPHECGNPKCKVIALGWLSDERFPRDHRHQPAASLANRITGARKLLVSATDAELHQLACVVPGDAPSSQAAVLYTLGLAPSFNIDSRSRQAQFYQSPNSQEPNFRALVVESERSLTSTPNNSCGTLAKTIKTINCSFLPPVTSI
jgi:hypothetical protein